MNTTAFRDAAERLLWTFVAAFVGQFVGGALLSLDTSTLQSAAVAGLGAVANAVLLLARWRLSVLPDPGQAIREATATETYRQIDVGRRP